MTPKRVCLVGLPRCGSQYISQLIVHNSEYTNLLEPFTFNHGVSLSETKRIYDTDNIIKDNYESLDYQIEDVLNVLYSAPEKDFILLKLFLVEVEYSYYRYIVDELKKLGFSFIIINRKNIIDQYLSLLISVSTDKWSNWTEEYYTDKVEISVEQLIKHDWFFCKLREFNTALSELNLLEYHTIYYENAVNDISKWLGKEINTDILLKKMSELSNSERIKNIDEVRQHINFLMSGTVKNIYR